MKSKDRILAKLPAAVAVREVGTFAGGRIRYVVQLKLSKHIGKTGESMKTKLSGFVALCAALSFQVSHATDGHGTVAVQQGNVVYTAPSGATQVLTETGADDNPMLSPDGKLVAFTRLTRQANEQDGEPPVRDLWVIRVDDQKAMKTLSTCLLASVVPSFRPTARPCTS
jgi:hypothetical protein